MSYTRKKKGVNGMSYKYGKTFKEEAVKLSDEIGVKKASEQLGVVYTTLSSWRGKRKKHGDLAYIGSGNKYLHKGVLPQELALQRENEELRRANAILKEALVFFVKDQTK